MNYSARRTWQSGRSRETPPRRQIVAKLRLKVSSSFLCLSFSPSREHERVKSRRFQLRLWSLKLIKIIHKAHFREHAESSTKQKINFVNQLRWGVPCWESPAIHNTGGKRKDEDFRETVTSQNIQNAENLLSKTSRIS